MKKGILKVLNNYMEMKILRVLNITIILVFMKK